MPLGPLRVGAALADVGAPVEHAAETPAAGTRSAARPGRDLPDGVRPWRDGDETSAVHWPSSLRSQELVVRQLLRDSDERWIVRARTATDDPDGEAARVRRSLHDGSRAGASVSVQVDAGEPCPLATRDDMIRWSAEFEPSPGTPAAEPPWWRRRIRLTAPEPQPDLVPRGRWIVAAAGAPPLVMLLQPLGYGAFPMAIAVAGIAIAAAITARTGAHMRGLRQLAGVLTAGAIAASLIDPSRVTSVASSLRYLMPQILVVLIVLQGFECVDRRSARVSLACSATLTAYAAGVRVDEQLAAWLFASCALLGWAMCAVARPEVVVRARGRARRLGRAAAVSLAAATAVVAILALLPVPRGPAQLTLPSWLEEKRSAGDDGSLAAPDGSPLLGGSGGRRGGSGEASAAGSYAGFSATMDTSLRGDLGDEVVLRVKAPSPDYWRGQTYRYFDGRTWYVDDRTGARSEGPDHEIAPAEGDVSSTGDQFIQTFYVEVDLPNLVFAATSARRVLLDAPLWQRPDGALRAGFVLPAGSAYTVISERSKPTEAGLRRAGNVATRSAPQEYLQLPASTTERVQDLARELATGTTSTYDTILAIEAWLGANVVYDLDAPAPAEDADAVDDFLFESRRGFCEQIASATAVLLRSLGVPARVATGFVPSSRDGVAGVWISRAADAHAWVEVHFPGYGWVPFDPTASVPLSGDADPGTIGGELLTAITRWIGAHLTVIVGAALGFTTCTGAIRFVRSIRERRRRGRWGRLQDRFVAAAVRRGAPITASNAQLAESFDAPEAVAVARVLDASAFAASWVDDDDEFARAAAAVRVLD
jgi:transglutaminase-like putative cysteine protease